VLDLSGNVSEWCLNEYDKPKNTQVSGSETRVLRGGAWPVYQDETRAAYRDGLDPVNRSYFIGFRLVRAPVP
jgi:formylglycine-generating enzyme required for sulfatase activity